MPCISKSNLEMVDKMSDNLLLNLSERDWNKCDKALLNNIHMSRLKIVTIVNPMIPCFKPAGILAAVIALVPMAKQHNKVMRSINLSTTRLLVATVRLMPMALGNTSALMTSPRRSGNRLLSATDPKKGEAQFK